MIVLLLIPLALILFDQLLPRCDPEWARRVWPWVLG
jgi:hypothetical protein